MFLKNHRDQQDEVLRRSAQLDPWVMYIVVRRGVVLSFEQLAIATAQATMLCTDRYEHHSVWEKNFSQWKDQSFRKVTLDAKPAAWKRLQDYDCGLGSVNNEAVVCVLPPRQKSENDSLIRGLQAYKSDLPFSANTGNAQDFVPQPGVMTFVVNHGANMSCGKLIAQVSHAVLMCAWSEWSRADQYREGFIHWKNTGYPCVIAPTGSWELVRNSDADGVIVRDAGLTEVSPGTETVIALPPKL